MRRFGRGGDDDPTTCSGDAERLLTNLVAGWRRTVIRGTKMAGKL